MSTSMFGVATATASPVAAALRRRQVGLLVAAHIRSKVFHQLSSNGPPGGIPFEPLFWPASTAPPSSSQSSDPGQRSGSENRFIASEWGMTFDQRVRMLARKATPPPSSDLFAPIPRPTELSLLASQKSAIPFAFHDDRSVLLSLSVPERFALGPLAAVFAPIRPPAWGTPSPLISSTPSVHHVADHPVKSTRPSVPAMTVVATPIAESEQTLEAAVMDAVQAEVAVEVEVNANDPAVGQDYPAWLDQFLAAAAHPYSNVDSGMQELRQRMHEDVKLARDPNRPSILQHAATSLLKSGRTSMANEVLAVISEEGWAVEPALALSAASAFLDQKKYVRNRLFATEFVAVPLAIPVLEDLPVNINEDVFCAVLARLHKSGTPGHVISQLADSYLASPAQRASPGSVPGAPNRAMANILITATAPIDMNLANTWLQRYRIHCNSLRQRGVERASNSSTPYTTLIAQQVQHGDFTSAFQTLDIMGVDNVQPSVALYNLLLSSRSVDKDGDTRSPTAKQDDAVERSFRVLQTLPADFLRNRADRFTFATIWKTHERWRARLILRTAAACPRTLWSHMMWRAQQSGQAGIPRLDLTTSLLNFALRVFLKRHDYAAAIIALEAIPRPDEGTREAIVGELSRRLSGELRTQQKAVSHIERVLHRRYEHGVDSEWQSEGVVRDKVRTLTSWTDCFLAENGGLATRGQWLRIYLSRGGSIADLDDIIKWLLGDVQHAESLSVHPRAGDRPPVVDRLVNRSDRRPSVERRPLRELLRRAHLAEHDASALSPIARQHEIVDRGLAKARRKMRPRPPTKRGLESEEVAS